MDIYGSVLDGRWRSVCTHIPYDAGSSLVLIRDFNVVSWRLHNYLERDYYVYPHYWKDRISIDKTLVKQFEAILSLFAHRVIQL